ncbi:MAG TPA: hypothetical protein VHG72_13585 [Polyangia bacterium]|nr:hypothetical protein [Polyangia bacterium]
MAGDGKPRPGQLADSLVEAGPRSLVYVDERGQVRSIAAYRRRMARVLVGGGGFMAAVTVLYWQIAGPTGLAVGGALTVMMMRHVPAWVRMVRAARLMALSKHAEAEMLLRSVSGSRFTASASQRGRAEQMLAMLATTRQDHATALALLTSALRRLPTDRRLRVQRRSAEYARVVTLVNLDRLAEARTCFVGLPRVMEGDYLRIQRAYTELYLALAEGERAFDRALLEEQAEQALAYPERRGWLTLLAWAYDRTGDTATVARLLAEAATRPSEDRMRAMFPKLAAWLDAR